MDKANENTEAKDESKTQGSKKQGQGTAKAAKPPKEPKAPKEPKPKKEKPMRETPAHMPKVDKVANQLPALTEESNVLFSAANNLATADIINLVAHLQIAVRRRGVATSAKLIQQGKDNPGRELKVGQRVKILTSTNPRFIGKEGTVSKVQRIRCYVELDERKGTYSVRTDGKGNEFSGDYFFTSDVAPVGASASSLNQVIERLTNPAPAIDINTLMDEEDAGDATGTTG